MIKGLNRNFVLITLTFLLGLYLTACSEGTGYGEVGVSSDHQPMQAPAATPTPNVSMSNMNMPAKTTTERNKPQKDEAPNQVTIENFGFQPATLTVKPGTKVTWVNRDDVPHTADDTDKRFRSGTLDTDDKFSFTFTTPGTYNYFCALHPRMTGQIIVK